MSRDEGALERLLHRRHQAIEARTATRKPRRDIRVLFFAGNRGRATRGAEPIAGQSGPPGHSTKAWPFRALDIEPAT